jgi:FUS-interacting serine-arginine-rich protein 1
VEFVDPYDASEAQYHMNRQVFFGREITVVLAAESRKRPEDMRSRARVRFGITIAVIIFLLPFDA